LFITNKQIKLSADDFRKQNNYLLNIVIRLTSIRKPELWEMIVRVFTSSVLVPPSSGWLKPFGLSHVYINLL